MNNKVYNKLTLKVIIILLLVNLLYSTVSIAVKSTSMQDFFSVKYFLGLCIVFVLMGIYAIAWQQILKRTEMTTAYIFKATGIIFVLLFSMLLFGEVITLKNIIGAVIIIVGIILFVKS